MAEKTGMAMTDTLLKTLTDLATTYFETPQLTIDPLKGDGSDRRIFEIESPASNKGKVIGVIHSNNKENEDFFLVTNAMKKAQIPVPDIYLTHSSKNVYLLQHLGQHTLAEKIDLWNTSGKKKNILPAYKKVIDYLIIIQTELPTYLSEFLKPRQMGEKDFLNDILYFRHDFLERFNLKTHLTETVERDIRSLIHSLTTLNSSYFVYRDFQSRNIMWPDGSPWFIDYQSAYSGSQLYDLASLLYSSKSGLEEDSREILLSYYSERSHPPFEYETLLNHFYDFVLIRRLRSLGSYGFLSQVKHKQRFIDAIPPTLAELNTLFQKKESLYRYPNLALMTRQLSDNWNRPPGN